MNLFLSVIIGLWIFLLDKWYHYGETIPFLYSSSEIGSSCRGGHVRKQDLASPPHWYILYYPKSVLWVMAMAIPKGFSMPGFLRPAQSSIDLRVQSPCFFLLMIFKDITMVLRVLQSQGRWANFCFRWIMCFNVLKDSKL